MNEDWLAIKGVHGYKLGEVFIQNVHGEGR